MMPASRDTGKPLPLTPAEEAMVAKASRKDVNGWIYVNISGDPYEMGFQNGYTMAKEWAAAVQAYEYMTLQTTGMTYQFFVDKANEMQAHLITDEYMQEMQGMADGATKAGVRATLADIVGWNAYMGLTGYWWPTVVSKYASAKNDGARFSTSHCSAFVATGSATADGKIVIGHETFT